MRQECTEQSIDTSYSWLLLKASCSDARRRKGKRSTSQPPKRGVPSFRWWTVNRYPIASYGRGRAVPRSVPESTENPPDISGSRTHLASPQISRRIHPESIQIPFRIHPDCVHNIQIQTPPRMHPASRDPEPIQNPIQGPSRVHPGSTHQFQAQDPPRTLAQSSG